MILDVEHVKKVWTYDFISLVSYLISKLCVKWPISLQFSFSQVLGLLIKYQSDLVINKLAILHIPSLEIKYETSDIKSNAQTFSTCSTSKII